MPLGYCLMLILAGLLAVGAGPPSSRAEDDSARASETEAEKKERETRRQCAIALCSTLHLQKPASGIVTCNVQKTWRKEVLTRILSRGRVSWPWGDTRCVSDLTFDRATLVKAMQSSDFEAQFDTYAVRCQIAGEKEMYDVTAELRPKVTFKQGRAVKASLNWGKIEAPTLAKSALWSITAADNTFGLLQNIAVEDINDFIYTRCAEVKEEWRGR